MNSLGQTWGPKICAAHCKGCARRGSRRASATPVTNPDPWLNHVDVVVADEANVLRHLNVRAGKGVQDSSPLGHPSLAGQEHTQRSRRATTTHQVRDRPDRLNYATQNPQSLGTAHLRTRTPGQVRQGHGGQYHLNRRANEDGRSLPSAEVAPPLLGSHDRHATPNGSTRPTGQGACIATTILREPEKS